VGINVQLVLLIASGLDKHGINSNIPIGYTHVNIAGSAEECLQWQAEVYQE
jgi:leucyl aminopeptidase